MSRGLYTNAELAGRHTKPMVVVEVWHGNLRAFDVQGSDPRDRIYACLAPAGMNDEAILEAAFHEFNVGDDPTFGEPTPAALEYRGTRRAKQNGYGTRSLSVGDEIRVDGRRYLCARFGWERIDSAAPLFEVLAEIEVSER